MMSALVWKMIVVAAVAKTFSYSPVSSPFPLNHMMWDSEQSCQSSIQTMIDNKLITFADGVDWHCMDFVVDRGEAQEWPMK